MHKYLCTSIDENKEMFGSLADRVRDSTGLLVPKLFLKLGGANPGMDKIRLASMVYWTLAKTMKKQNPISQVNVLSTSRQHRNLHENSCRVYEGNV